MHSQRRIPDDLSIRFLNPRGLLLIGGCELDEDEQRDFALICRDDLSLFRLPWQGYGMHR